MAPRARRSVARAPRGFVLRQLRVDHSALAGDEPDAHRAADGALRAVARKRWAVLRGRRGIRARRARGVGLHAVLRRGLPLRRVPHRDRRWVHQGRRALLLAVVRRAVRLLAGVLRPGRVVGGLSPPRRRRAGEQRRPGGSSVAPLLRRHHRQPVRRGVPG